MKPGWQFWFASQQPPQLAAVHRGGGGGTGVQAKPKPSAVQLSPITAQFWHGWAPLPQDVFEAPPMHWVPKQQPPQFAGPHVVPVEVQVWLTASHAPFGRPLQFWQACPPLPHWVTTVPPRQTPLPSQHPFGQLAGPQFDPVSGTKWSAGCEPSGPTIPESSSGKTVPSSRSERPHAATTTQPRARPRTTTDRDKAAKKERG
jgi:hypothetical protein